jgi:chromosomal replication initiation ATPase DnaA
MRYFLSKEEILKIVNDTKEHGFEYAFSLTMTDLIEKGDSVEVCDVLTCSDVLDVVSNYYGMTKEEMSKQNRGFEWKLSRFVYFFFCKKMTLCSWRVIGKEVCRDHATAIHGFNKVKGWLEIGDLGMTKTIRDIQLLLDSMIKESVNEVSL